MCLFWLQLLPNASSWLACSQRYDVRKRLERGFKSLVHASLDLDISAVSPDVYAQRFLAFVQQSTRAEVQITDV